jgi:hypothetical protein
MRVTQNYQLRALSPDAPPDVIEVDGLPFVLDFDHIHSRGEAEEAAGHVHDHKEVMQWAKSYAAQLMLNKRARRHH